MQVEEQQHKSSIKLLVRVQSVCAGAIYQGYAMSEMLFTGADILSMNGIDIFDDEKPDKPESVKARYITLLIGPIICVSGFLISYFTPLFTTKFERRQCMILSDLIFLLATALTQIPSLYGFMIARLLMGITCGIDLMITPLYIREVSPDNMASKTGSLFQANVFVGVIVGFLTSIPMQNFVSNDQEIGNSWRFVFAFPAFFSIWRLTVLKLFYKIDTPYYYYRNHDLNKGREALEQIFKPKYIQELEQQFMVPGSIDIQEVKTTQQLTLNQNSEAVNGNYNSILSEEIKILEEYDQSYKNRLKVGLVVNFCSQMTGCTAMIGLSPVIIGIISSDYEIQRCIILGSYIFLLLVATLGVAFNRKLARKKYLVGGFLVCSIFLFALAIISSFTTALSKNHTLQFVFLMFVFLFYASYSFSVGHVVVILTSDHLTSLKIEAFTTALWRIGQDSSFHSVYCTKNLKTTIKSTNTFQYGWKKICFQIKSFSFLRVQSVCAGGIYQGYVLTEMLFTGFYILSMNGIQIFDVSQNEKALTEQTRLLYLLIGPIFCVSGFIISYFIHLFTAKIERRQCMLISDVILIVATILTQIPSLYPFTIACLLMGITCGIDLIVTPLYIREISPDHMSSKTEFLFQANNSLGILVAFFIQMPMKKFVNNYQEISNYWHLIFFFPAIFSIIRLLSLVFIYKKDTPYYYYRKKQLREGREALEQIYQEKCILELGHQYLVPGFFDISEIQIDQCQDAESAQSTNNFNSLISQEIKIIQDYDKSYKNRLRVGILINFCQEKMSGGTAVIGFSGLVIGLLTNDPEMDR
ncbi:hypothetical protein ABPG72_010799 [Tetrahymena utriculariae]